MRSDFFIQSHNGFQPLKEVWLGDCYPIDYYEFFPPEERDFFQHITEITQEDLKKIKNKIEEFGITVLRKIEEIGMIPHVVDFRTRHFWDGGLHCLTVDIQRLGDCLDYWPGRGDAGIYRYT